MGWGVRRCIVQQGEGRIVCEVWCVMCDVKRGVWSVECGRSRGAAYLVLQVSHSRLQRAFVSLGTALPFPRLVQAPLGYCGRLPLARQVRLVLHDPFLVLTQLAFRGTEARLHLEGGLRRLLGRSLHLPEVLLQSSTVGGRLVQFFTAAIW